MEIFRKYYETSGQKKPQVSEVVVPLWEARQT